MQILLLPCQIIEYEEKKEVASISNSKAKYLKNVLKEAAYLGKLEFQSKWSCILLTFNESPTSYVSKTVRLLFIDKFKSQI